MLHHRSLRTELTPARLTGATRGIGAKLALALSKAGADVILVQRNNTNTATKEMIEKEGGKADIVVCDLASKDDVAKLIPHVVNDLKRTLDIVVNCGMSHISNREHVLTDVSGGIQRRHPVENFPDDDWQEVLQVNLNTVFQITRDAGTCSIRFSKVTCG